MNATDQAAAGPRGDRPRSDARVEIERRESGGVEVRLTSKVELLYGDAIRRQVEEGTLSLGLENVLVTVEDGGALPFVLDARLEACARALGADVGDGLLPALLPANVGTSDRHIDWSPTK